MLEGNAWIEIGSYFSSSGFQTMYIRCPREGDENNGDNSTSNMVACLMCGFKSHIKNITRHIRQHFGDKPYKCHLCSNSYTRKEGLRKHLISHGTEI